MESTTVYYQSDFIGRLCSLFGITWGNYPDSKVHGANMGPTWVLSAPDGPHVGSVHENHQTHRTFPMARPKCLMRDLTNLKRIYKAHQTNVWWIMKVFQLHWCWPQEPCCQGRVTRGGSLPVLNWWEWWQSHLQTTITTHQIFSQYPQKCNSVIWDAFGEFKVGSKLYLCCNYDNHNIMLYWITL